MSAPFGSIPFGGSPVDVTVRPLTLAEMAERDLTDLFFAHSSTGFAVLASIEPAGETAFYVSGIFDKTPVQETVFSPVQAWRITFMGREAQLRSVRHGDLVVIGGLQYEVSSIDSDGTGISTITLSEATDG